jgi:hypothetical protein
MAPTGTRVGRVADRCYVVLAHADRVEDETLRAGIRDSATDLVDLSEKAREAEEVMQASTDSDYCRSVPDRPHVFVRSIR